jgi:hypothetical protein
MNEQAIWLLVEFYSRFSTLVEAAGEAAGAGEASAGGAALLTKTVGVVLTERPTTLPGLLVMSVS